MKSIPFQSPYNNASHIHDHPNPQTTLVTFITIRVQLYRYTPKQYTCTSNKITATCTVYENWEN